MAASKCSLWSFSETNNLKPSFTCSVAWQLVSSMVFFCLKYGSRHRNRIGFESSPALFWLKMQQPFGWTPNMAVFLLCSSSWNFLLQYEKLSNHFFFCRLQLLAVGSNNKVLKNMSYTEYEILVTSQLNSAHYAPLSSFINHEAGGGRGCDMLFLSWMTLSSPNVWDVVQNTLWLLGKQYKHRFKEAFSPISL